jgi:hypothetical protein
MTSPIKDQSEKSGMGLTRRELIRLGLKGGSVVVVSLASPTVFACVRPSSYGSLSSHSGPNKPKDYTCGWGPGNWCDDRNKTEWSKTGCVRTSYKNSYGQTVPATKHHDRFTNGYTDDLLYSMRYRTEFAKYCAAAHLNAKSGKCNVLTVTEIGDMWKACAFGGTYEVTAGCHWTQNDCLQYLKTTCNTV